jgi:hypothetical protein
MLPMLQAVLRQALPNPPELMDLAPLFTLWLLMGIIVVIAVFLWRKIKKTTTRLQPTWSCAFGETTPRIQYTASSFSQMAMDLFHGVLLPKKNNPKIQGIFPSRFKFSSETPDLILDRALAPAFRKVAWLLSWLRVAQGGMLPIYLLYLVITLLGLLAWTLA